MFKSFKKTVPYDDIYLVNMVKVDNHYDDDSAMYKREVTVSGLSTLVYINDSMKLVSLVDDEPIEEYVGNLYSEEILKGYDGYNAPTYTGYINKRSLNDLDIVKDLKEKIILSKRELRKISDKVLDLEEDNQRMVITLSADPNVAIKQLLSQGIMVVENDAN